jgi:hypothetical protein
VSITGEVKMLLRHISPRSTDWMDAMDEGSGGRGWEKLAPEEQAKLLRERPRSQNQGESQGQIDSWSTGTERRPARPAGYFATASPSR